MVVGAHGTGSTGQEYTVTKEDIDMYLSYHSHLRKEMEEAEIAQIIAEVWPISQPSDVIDSEVLYWCV